MANVITGEIEHIQINPLIWQAIGQQQLTGSVAFTLELADFLPDEFDGTYGIKTGYDLPDGLLLNFTTGVVLGTPTNTAAVSVVFTAKIGSVVVDSGIVVFTSAISAPAFSANAYSSNYRENQTVARTFTIDWGGAQASDRTLAAVESSPYVSDVVISGNQATVTLDLSNVSGNQTAVINLTATNSAGSDTATWTVFITEAGAMWTVDDFSLYEFISNTGIHTIDFGSILDGDPTPTVAFSSGTVPTNLSINALGNILSVNTNEDLPITGVPLTATNVNGSDDLIIDVVVAEQSAPTADSPIVLGFFFNGDITDPRGSTFSPNEFGAFSPLTYITVFPSSPDDVTITVDSYTGAISNVSYEGAGFTNEGLVTLDVGDAPGTGGTITLTISNDLGSITVTFEYIIS